MPITWGYVEDLDEKLADVPVQTQSAILLDVYAMLSTERWGAKLDLAAKYMAAHMGVLALRGASGAVGPVTSERLGDAAVSYATPQMLTYEGDLGSTFWGQRFMALRRGAFGPFAVVL